MVRATLDHIDQAVLIFDAKARLAGWNRRLREVFAPPSALLASGTPFTQVLDDLMRRRQLGQGRIRQVLTDWVDGPALRPPLGLDIVQEDGTELHLSAQAMPDRGFVMSFNDLTTERRAIAEMHRLNETLEARVQARTMELEAARDAAERANASKSRFVASASHDLLQPLNAAKLFLSSLATLENTPAQSRLVDRVQSAFTSVEDILAALLDLSKFDIGAARARREAVPLAPLFRAPAGRISAHGRQARAATGGHALRTGRAQRPGLSETHLAEPCVQCPALHTDRARAAGRTALRRQSAARGVGYRSRHSARPAGRDFQGIHAPEPRHRDGHGLGAGDC